MGCLILRVLKQIWYKIFYALDMGKNLSYRPYESCSERACAQRPIRPTFVRSRARAYHNLYIYMCDQRDIYSPLLYISVTLQSFSYILYTLTSATINFLTFSPSQCRNKLKKFTFMTIANCMFPFCLSNQKVAIIYI